MLLFDCYFHFNSSHLNTLSAMLGRDSQGDGKHAIMVWIISQTLQGLDGPRHCSPHAWERSQSTGLLRRLDYLSCKLGLSGSDAQTYRPLEILSAAYLFFCFSV